MKKLLIIYYSWSNGNTERIAKMLQSETDSDILKIDTVVPYSGSYDDVVNQGQNEVQRGYEPEIKPLDINIADYDVIAVGTPTWWYTMAPAVKTFLHQQDFTGKTVVPFMTNGGWPGHVIKDMKSGPATTFAPLQAAFISFITCPGQPPFVIKGTTVFPVKSCWCRNVFTAGAIVYHHVGVPTAMTS